MRILVNCTNNKRLLGRLIAFVRHFNMVLVEVLEMWTEQRKREKHDGRTELVQKERYIPKMFLKGVSVILIIKMQEEDDAASVVMGPKEMPGPDNATPDMDTLDERRVETHMFCPD